MSDTNDRIQSYYAADPGKEWRRLESLDTGPIEFELTTRRLAAFLEPGSRVLDIGGGPGRYTVWLAQQGHRVTLADIVPELLEFARARIAEAGVAARVEDIVVADVCDLSRWDTGSFDAVLCLGPFYHLLERERREQAAGELARVTKAGGPLFAAFMPRLSLLKRSIATREEWAHLRNVDFVRAVLEEGKFLNDNPGRFDAGYGARPEEIGPFFESFGFDTKAVLAAEGFAPPVSDALIAMRAADPESYAAALDLLELTAGEPPILGAANHLLCIGRRR